MRLTTCVSFASLWISSIACAASVVHVPTTNPSFPITVDEASRKLAVEAKAPKKLDRPLIILGGFLDIGIGPTFYANRLERYVSGDILRVAFFDCADFPSCRQRIVDRIDHAFGEFSGRETIEVDVIGQSMGGLVGFYSAMNDPRLGKRLKIRRLYTISSPLQGANRAERMPKFLDVWPLVRDMRPGSALYDRIAKAKFDFDLISYTLTDDHVVGERYASLPGRGVWWLDSTPIGNAHAGADFDPRIMLDIVKRLRGETPVTTSPAAPLPTTLPSK